MTIQGYKGMASGRAWSNLTPLAASLLLVLAGSAQATESPQTPYLVGNKPKAANVQITPPSPNRKDTVSVSWNYEDVDGDKESGTKVEWLIDNQVVSKDKTYKIPLGAANKKLEVRVTPRSAEPANPQVGDEVKNSVEIRSDFFGNIVDTPTFKDVVEAQEAEKKCNSKGGRLPSPKELQDIYEHNTTADKWGKDLSNEMCTLYGWPIYGCGAELLENGSQASYWTNEIKPSSNGTTTHRTSIHMHGDSKAYTYGHPTAKALVVCMKRY